MNFVPIVYINLSSSHISKMEEKKKREKKDNIESYNRYYRKLKLISVRKGDLCRKSSGYKHACLSSTEMEILHQLQLLYMLLS